MSCCGGCLGGRPARPCVLHEGRLARRPEMGDKASGLTSRCHFNYNTGVCEKNDRLIKRLYRAMCLLGRKIQVETHIALYGLLFRRSFFFPRTPCFVLLKRVLPQRNLAIGPAMNRSPGSRGTSEYYNIVQKKNPAGRLARRPAVLFWRLARRPVVKEIADRIFV